MTAPTLDTGDPTDAAAVAAAADLCRRRAPELFWASVFLPRAKRRGALALGAFILMISDAFAAVEGAAPAERPTSAANTAAQPQSAVSHPQSMDAHASLAGSLADRLDDIYAQRLELPLPQFRSREQRVLHAAARTINTFGVPRSSFEGFIAGRGADGRVMRYATWPALHRQLLVSGGSVAEMLAAVVGVRHSEAPVRLRQLGAGLRLAMILRELPGHLAAGRLPLPLADLVSCGCMERELLEGEASAAAREAVRRGAQRARGLLREGAGSICWLAGDGGRLFAAALYLQGEALLDQIDRRGGNVFARRVEVSVAEKLRRLPALLRLARQEVDPSQR